MTASGVGAEREPLPGGAERAGATRSSVSVVIPCHNYGRFLLEAVDSVLSQASADDEIVIVDDGSRDETAEVAERLRRAHPSIRVISHAQASGPAAAFNAGVRGSTRELVVILDADDRLGPGYLDVMAQILRDPRFDFAYAGEHLFGAVDAVHPAPSFDARELACENYINKSAMFRRALFDRIGGFLPEFDHLGLEDWEFWVRAAESGAVGRSTGECWLEYRRHSSGSRNRMSRRVVLLTHLRVRRMHPHTVRYRDVLRWMHRSLRRNAGSLVAHRRLLRPLS